MASSHPFKKQPSVKPQKTRSGFFLRQIFSGNLNEADHASQVSHRNGPVIMKYGFMVDILLWSNMVEAIIRTLIVTIAIVGSILIGVGVTADAKKFKIGGG